MKSIKDILILLILISGCQSRDNTVSIISNNKGDSLLICHYQEIKDTVELHLSDLIDDFKIIRFENSERAIFKSRVLPTITNNYIGIPQVGAPFLLFDKEGKFINNIGRIGQGPGEYPMTIYDAIIDEEENEIHLAPFAFLNKVLVYDLEGSLIREQTVEDKLNKPKIRLKEDERLVIIHLPLEMNQKKILAFQYDQERKLIETKQAPGHLWVKDFSQELFAYHNVPEFSFYITSCDTLFHYLPETNKILPKLTMDFGNMEEIPIHIYNELPNHYVVTVFNKGSIFIDKQRQTANYVKIVNDFCGNMDEVIFNFKNGWAYRMFEPDYLIQYIENRLKESNCTEKDREQLQGLLESINKNDNNILFLGKLKGN